VECSSLPWPCGALQSCPRPALPRKEPLVVLMSDPVPEKATSAKPAEDLLDSWKEIAAYLNRDVTTVQRWERREGMPVHRHLHDRLGSVSASRAELDAWSERRRLRVAEETDAGLPASEPRQPKKEKARRRNTLTAVLLGGACAFLLAVGVILWLQSKEYFWRSPIQDSRFQTITDFDGVAQAAAISRDGQFVAFLSDRDGPMDVWVTQAGSGQFHNLTHGSAPELVNPSVRTVGFTPDGALVTFWIRKPNSKGGGDVSIWAVPTLGGEPRPYLEGVAEYDWTRDGSRLVYHTAGPGDPMYVSEGSVRAGSVPIFTAPSGLHSHFPVWSRDTEAIYFVQGALPDKLDLWRISASGGKSERVTSHSGLVSYPVFLDERTLLYLASDPDGSGPWLHSIDVKRRISHRLASGLDRCTSLSGSADGRRLAVTMASPKSTLWHLPVTHSADAKPESIPSVDKNVSSPRAARDFVLYITKNAGTESIIKLAGGKNSELWSAPDSHILGGPSISRDGRQVAFTVEQRGKSILYAIASDGTNARIVTDQLDLKGDPAWDPNGGSILSAAEDRGLIHLFRIALDGSAPTTFVAEYSVDPNWAPDGSYVVYSGPDIGTNFSLKAVTAEGAPRKIPDLVLTRGTRHVTFLPGGHELVYLRGEIQHKNLWAVNVDTGADRQLTQVAADFQIQDFDVSPGGQEFILQRVQEHSNIVMLTRSQP